MDNQQIDLELVPSNLRRSWGWLLALGILFVILGCVGISQVVGLTLVSVMFFGVLLIIAGVFQLIDVFKYRQWKGMVIHGLIGVLYLIGGALIIHDPVLASSLITVMIAWILIVVGIARFVMAIALRDAKGWGWLLLAGITAIILGVLILMQWPWSGLWVIGLFIAIELLVNGWTYIFLAFAMRTE
jgi:uncharacterized membrane protein HdeD (DUF308 family)